MNLKSFFFRISSHLALPFMLIKFILWIAFRALTFYKRRAAICTALSGDFIIFSFQTSCYCHNLAFLYVSRETMIKYFI